MTVQVLYICSHASIPCQFAYDIAMKDKVIVITGASCDRRVRPAILAGPASVSGGQTH